MLRVDCTIWVAHQGRRVCHTHCGYHAAGPGLSFCMQVGACSLNIVTGIIVLVAGDSDYPCHHVWLWLLLLLLA